MKNPLEFRFVECLVGNRRQWRVQVRRSGLILLASESYTSRRSAEKMVRNILNAVVEGNWVANRMPLKRERQR